MTETIQTDICIIGAGSGGLVVAAVAAPLGVKTVLIEGHKMGGDCLNYGCVPSKAVIAAGKAAEGMRTSGKFGIPPAPGVASFADVHDHIHEVIAGIAPHDSVERFEELGCTVIQAHAKFLDAKTVQAGDAIIKAKRFVLATGSHAAVPPIPGLQDTPYLTNETLWSLKDQPEHVLILGAGPIGLEMAQAHRRLGARVTVIEMDRAMNREDPELAAIVVDQLRAEGVQIHEHSKAVLVAGEAGAVQVTVEQEGGQHIISGSHLLVAAGRVPTVDGMDLEKAGIEYDKKGIKVDARLRTSNKKVFAVGDCRGNLQFTHAAAYDAGIVIRNALFWSPAKAKDDFIPRVTYTEPELASVGLSEAEARQVYGDTVRVARFPYAENDRARAERATQGLVKVVVGKRGKILGASIAGKQGGELLQPWILALNQGLSMKAFTDIVAPYPTLGEINKRVASEYYRDALFSGKTKALVRFLQRLS